MKIKTKKTRRLRLEKQYKKNWMRKECYCQAKKVERKLPKKKLYLYKFQQL